MKQTKRRPDGGEDVNVLPVMSVMFLMIPALLLAMEVASMAAITVSPAHVADGGREASTAKENFQLEVSVASDGFWVKANDAHVGVAQAPSVARVGEDYDYAALEAMARELKASAPQEQIVYVTAEGDVPLQVIVATMDAMRGSDCKLSAVSAGEDAPTECLFWQPIVRSL